MAYNITISPLADVELAEAYGYYANISVKVLKMFDKDILARYAALQQNPYFKIRYRNVRALPLKKFPFIIFLRLTRWKIQ